MNSANEKDAPVETTQPPVRDDVHSLRRCLRDLAAFSSLSAAWSTRGSREIAEDLANVLCRAIPAVFVYVRVTGLNGTPAIELARTHGGSALPAKVHELAAAVSPLLAPGDRTPTPAIANPFGSGALHVVITPLGCDGRCGIVVTGWPQTDAPGESDRLLMGVAANQAALALQRQQAEEVTRRSERELADFFDNATAGLHWVGPDGTILRANRAELELLGYSADEYVGHNIAEFHVDSDVIEDILRRLRAGEELHEYEARLRCKDGSIRHVAIHSNVFWEDGRFVHTRCFTRDITERKRAEMALLESERRFREMIDALPAAVYTTDAEGRLTHFNPAAVEFSGRMPEPGTDRWCVSWKLYHPDGRPMSHDESPMAIALKEGRAVRGQEAVLERPDGARRWFVPYPTPLRDAEGRIVGGINMLVDITARRRSEEANARLAAIVASSDDAIVSKNLDGIITSWNRGAERIFGYTADEAIGRPATFLMPPDRTHEEAEILERVRRGEDAHYETVRCRKDGAPRTISLSVSPVFDAAGRVVGASKIARDITERKNMEEALRESEARFRALVTASSDVVYRMSPDWREMHFLQGRDFIPDTHESSRGWLEKYIYSDDQPRVLAVISEAVRNRSVFEFEHRVRRVDGSLGWTMSRAVPILDANGDIVEWFGAASDTTDRRKAEDRLRLLWEAAALLLTANDPDAMLRELFVRIGPHLGLDTYFNYMVDETGEALRLQSCIGVSEQAARSIARLELGEAISGTVAQQRQSIVVTEIQQSHDPQAQLVKSFGIHSYACIPLMSDGQLLGTLSFASRTRDRFEPDELAFLETLCSYVTAAYDRLRLLGQLKEADRRKDEFLATLAHELRNPLAPVRNAVNLLRLQGPDRPELRWGRDVIDRQVSHLTRLIDDLLDVSRITRNKLELRMERVELSEVVKGAVETSRPLIEQGNHDLTLTLPAEPIYLKADLVRLAQVFMNLLTNAAKYTEPGGRIWITAEEQGREVVVRVKDTGVGIPPEKLPRLFEMFFQVDRSLERSQGGLGIGLSLVRRLVELHGGSVKAYSAGVGRGSEFTVRLPVLVEESQPQPPRAWPDKDVTKSTTARRILVVDDNRDSADSIAALLALSGNEVRTAYDGLAALQTAGQFRPDMALLDIGMPKLNGYDACRRIREQSWGRGMVLIALTGWGQEEDRRRSEEAGFDGHLVKPLDPMALTTLLAGFAAPTTG